MKRGDFFILSGWLAALAGVLLFLARPHRSILPARLWKIPPFEATGVTVQGSSLLRRDDLFGHAWVADFIYTRCGGPCPLMSQKMAALQRILPPSVELVSFSVDPEHDTPDVLKEYARRFHADPARWVFARVATPQALHALVHDGFHLALQAQTNAPVTASVLHSVFFILVDAEGIVRGVYDSSSGTALESLRRDAELLALER